MIPPYFIRAAPIQAGAVTPETSNSYGQHGHRALLTTSDATGHGKCDEKSAARASELA